MCCFSAKIATVGEGKPEIASGHPCGKNLLKAMLTQRMLLSYLVSECDGGEESKPKHSSTFQHYFGLNLSTLYMCLHKC